HGAATTPVAQAQQLLRNTGFMAAGLSNCDSSEGPLSLSAVPLEDDDRAAAAAAGSGAGTSSLNGLNRIYSLPAAHTCPVASSHRAAPQQRCAAEVTSREGQAANPGPGGLFQLRKPSRDRSRNGVSTSASTDSPVAHLHPQHPQQLQQSAVAHGLSLGLMPMTGENNGAGAPSDAAGSGGSG
ncbi:hypothetical protein Vretifemale_4725, partial [Volvox reticuliferus]